MSWRFRKVKNIGPIKTTFSKNGVGSSIGFFGFRFGITAEGKKYWSFGILNTGFYYIKYY